MNSPLLILFTLFLLTSPLPTTHSLPFSTYQTLFSLSHSLLTRVATLRQSRGDLLGSTRAKAIAKKLEPGLGFSFWRFVWSVGWDYLKNYAWKDMSTFEMFGAVSDMNELMRGLTELTRLGSEERVVWVQQNYGSVLRSSKSLLARLLKLFRQSVRFPYLRFEELLVVIWVIKFEQGIICSIKWL